MSNRAEAQTESDDLPDATSAWTVFAPVPPPPLGFHDVKGKKLSLANFRGHVLLVNLWATWCGPCKEELPTFAALAPKLKSFGGLVLPISIDVDGVAAVRAYFELRGINNLPILVDPSGDDLDMMQTNGIPVTMVVNPEGKAVARLDGAADWDTDKVIGFMKHLAEGLKPKPDDFTQA
ncbi:Thiol-disulfide isomerase or thioredoxin [Acidocella aminolytica 101 = DSM 11237]|jgi:thiol-disulfide isomerase/thioredoxin|nr:thiol-disulfide isomerase [Acidocella aminolytica 101 = DSM 11237]SHF60949.1 Thiol-disulfide isomerase or thioredoxin [Acidocella aminolytica 101 = DSM 11237]